MGKCPERNSPNIFAFLLYIHTWEFHIWVYGHISLIVVLIIFFFCFPSKMGNSQSISMLTYGVDDTVLPIDPLNVNFRYFIDNFTDIIDDELYVVEGEQYVEFLKAITR